MTNSKHEFPAVSTSEYGYFDDESREYVITDPKTPYPWINYLGNKDFIGMISNTGGGYAFYRDAKLRRLTRYRYNSIPNDNNGRYFYIVDGETTWSPGWKPVRTPLDDYHCCHGLGYTRISAAKNGVEVTSNFFVPLDTTAEVHHLEIRNLGTKTRKLKLFSFAEWCLWNAEDDMTNFQRNFSTGEVQVDGSTIIHATEYRERRNHFGFYSVNRAIDGFDTDRSAFVGDYNGLEMPQAVAEGEPRNSLAHGWSPIASHYLELTLEPGEKTDLIFVLGYVENGEDKWTEDGQINTRRADELKARFESIGDVRRELAALADFWDGVLSHLTLEAEDERLNRLVNTWNPYQCMTTFNLSRSASLFESGVSRGMGFRDSNQDLLGMVHILPARTRQRILDLAATQFANGSAFHQYQPLTKQGNAAIGGGFNDDPLWLIMSTAAYIKETGDAAILDVSLPFADRPQETASLFDHLHASFHHVVNNLGPHGLPLIGRADWNDCLNLNCYSDNPDESFQTTTIDTEGVAESLMIAGLFVWCGKDYVTLCQRTGRSQEGQAARLHLDHMVEAVGRHGWDGAWFLRAYRHDGEKVGSSECRQGQIYVEPQGWCVMAGIGLEDGRAEQALNSVKAFLDTDHGVVLLYPAYSRYDKALGEISSYPQGYKENGSVFCHTNPWIVIAETLLGRGDQAFEYFAKTAPPYREQFAERHKTEPYVYAQMIAGKEAAVPGEAKNSWLTGTAAWSFYAASQYLLGIRPEFDGLRVDPCIPHSWKGFQVKRKFRGATYHIKVKNPEHVSKGVASIWVNGQPLEGEIIPCFKAGSVHKIDVVMGRPEVIR